jgi:hypothetical protein
MQEISHIFQHFGASLDPWKDLDKSLGGKSDGRPPLFRGVTLPRIFHDFWEIKISLLNFGPGRPKEELRS